MTTTIKEIESKHRRCHMTPEAAKYETAKQIRSMLDKTLRRFPGDDRDDIETEIIEMALNGLIGTSQP